MGIVNNPIIRVQTVRPEYLQASAATLLLIAFSLVFGPTPKIFGASGTAKTEVRMAYFPNLTHSPALIGVANQTFAKSLPQFQFSTRVVNAGPEAMEALLAGAIDVAYVGPSPALNTYVKTNGKALRILAGVCEGGAALVCREGLPIESVKDLSEYRVAVPEFGGTQDVALRHFLKQANLTPREAGGTVEILPIKNPEIVALFKQKQIDAAWVPEPWVSRLVSQTRARIVVQESELWPSHKFPTTVMVASTKFIETNPEAVATLQKDNREIIAWINHHPSDAKAAANSAIGTLTGKPLSKVVIDQAWPRLKFSSAQDRAGLQASASAAIDAGYLKTRVKITEGIWFSDSKQDENNFVTRSK